MKRNQVTVEGCTFRVLPNKQIPGSADIVIEQGGHELFRSNEDYAWLMRFSNMSLAETIGASLHLGK